MLGVKYQHLVQFNLVLYFIAHIVYMELKEIPSQQNVMPRREILSFNFKHGQTYQVDYLSETKILFLVIFINASYFRKLLAIPLK